MQFWAYFVDFSCKRPPLVSGHFLVRQGWSLTRELTAKTCMYDENCVKHTTMIPHKKRNHKLTMSFHDQCIHLEYYNL